MCRNRLRHWRKLTVSVTIHISLNAGSGADLTNAINSLLKSLPKQFITGVTYYDNPRINELAKFSYFPATIERIDGGKFKTYKMSFDLKER